VKLTLNKLRKIVRYHWKTDDICQLDRIFMMIQVNDSQQIGRYY